jgi:hypothetical protein
VFATPWGLSLRIAPLSGFVDSKIRSSSFSREMSLLFPA